MRTLKDNLARLSTRLRSRLRVPTRRVTSKAPAADVVIISYPKTGRTWLRMMIGQYLCQRYSIDQSHVLDTRSVTDRAGLKSTEFSHDGSNLRKKTSWRSLPTSKISFRNKRVLLLTRSVEDAMVSAWFQVSKRLGIFDGTISDMLRDDRFGVRKYITFYESWFAHQHVPLDFSHTSYEDLHRNPAKCLNDTLLFMGEATPDTTTVSHAVECSSFRNMQQLERSQKLPQQAMRPTDPNDADTHKVRRGVVGGFTEYLSPDDIEYITSLARSSDCPFIRTAP